MFDKLRALLIGEEIYKKFGSSSQMNVKPFDPLEKGSTPDVRGYGKRIMKLSCDLTKVEIIKLQGHDKSSANSS